MSLNAATIEFLLSKGLSGEDLLEVARRSERRIDPTATERKRRQRAKSRRDVTRDPPNDIDILTPHEASEANASSPQPRAWALPVGVALQVWDDLLTNRKRKRLPNTETAWKAFNDDLVRVAAQTGIPPPKLIEMCAAKGWGAIYDPRETRHGKSSGIGNTAATFAMLNASHDEPF
jgi:hypothetical protein